MEKQLLKFKGEVQKEQLELDRLQLEVKECSMEQKKKATLLKELKGLSNQASMAGQELQKALNKKGQKKLKAEQVSHVLKECLATLTDCKNSKAGAKKQLKAYKGCWLLHQGWTALAFAFPTVGWKVLLFRRWVGKPCNTFIIALFWVGLPMVSDSH